MLFAIFLCLTVAVEIKGGGGIDVPSPPVAAILCVCQTNTFTPCSCPVFASMSERMSLVKESLLVGLAEQSGCACCLQQLVHVPVEHSADKPRRAVLHGADNV